MGIEGPYIPTEEEIQKAEASMTSEQRVKSAVREIDPTLDEYMEKVRREVKQEEKERGEKMEALKLLEQQEEALEAQLNEIRNRIEELNKEISY